MPHQWDRLSSSLDEMTTLEFLGLIDTTLISLL
jgi:hypothetical protein